MDVKIITNDSFYVENFDQVAVNKSEVFKLGYGYEYLNLVSIIIY